MLSRLLLACATHIPRAPLRSPLARLSVAATDSSAKIPKNDPALPLEPEAYEFFETLRDRGGGTTSLFPDKSSESAIIPSTRSKCLDDECLPPRDSIIKDSVSPPPTTDPASQPLTGLINRLFGSGFGEKREKHPPADTRLYFSTIAKLRRGKGAPLGPSLVSSDPWWSGAPPARVATEPHLSASEIRARVDDLDERDTESAAAVPHWAQKHREIEKQKEMQVGGKSPVAGGGEGASPPHETTIKIEHEPVDDVLPPDLFLAPIEEVVHGADGSVNGPVTTRIQLAPETVASRPQEQRRQQK